MRVYLDNCCFARPFDDQLSVVIRLETDAKLHVQYHRSGGIAMLSNTVVKNEGMRVLSEKLGLVDSERFIVLLRREPFDYTEWRQGLFKDVPLDAFLKNANDHRIAESNTAL